MEDNEKKVPEEPEKEGLLDKAKKLYEKADDFIDDKVEDLKKTKAFGKVSDALDKAGDFVEDKIDEIKSGEA